MLWGCSVCSSSKLVAGCEVGADAGQFVGGTASANTLADCHHYFGMSTCCAVLCCVPCRRVPPSLLTARTHTQVAQVFGYHLSVYVEGEQEEVDGAEELLQPRPLVPLQVNLSAASGGRMRAAGVAGGGGSGGSGGVPMSPAIRVSVFGELVVGVDVCEGVLCTYELLNSSWG